MRDAAWLIPMRKTQASALIRDPEFELPVGFSLHA